jgi:hypothetical protein
LCLQVENGIITSEALYVPEIKISLLSIAQLAKEGVVNTFDQKGITLRKRTR